MMKVRGHSRFFGHVGHETTHFSILCLGLWQVPKCFGLVHMSCARSKIYLHIVPVTNILCQTKRWFAFSKIGFCAGTKVFEESLNAVKVLGWHKTFWDLNKDKAVVLLDLPTSSIEPTKIGTFLQKVFWNIFFLKIQRYFSDDDSEKKRKISTGHISTYFVDYTLWFMSNSQKKSWMFSNEGAMKLAKRIHDHTKVLPNRYFD